MPLTTTATASRPPPGTTTRRPRRTFDKRSAKVVHRSHLLLLLGRALLLDKAADAPLVQVTTQIYTTLRSCIDK